MATGAGGLGGGRPGGGCGATGYSGGACTGPWDVLALGAEKWEVGVLVRGGIGADCFPLDMGEVGSELACVVGWVCLGFVCVCTVGLAGRLMAWSFWIAVAMVVSVLSNISWTRAVSSSARLSRVSEVLVLWKWTVRLLRYIQQYQVFEN